MTRWLVLVLMMGCADAGAGAPSVGWDGGACDPPGGRLYELRFLPVVTTCAEPIRTRVRRLDGPSVTGLCLMTSAGAADCGVDILETCDELDGESEIIRGGVEYTRHEWRGVVAVVRRDPEGAETCSGRYAVRSRRVY